MHKPCLYLEGAASWTERSSCIAMCAECLSIHNIRDSNPSEVDEEVASDRRLVWSFPWWSLISTIIYYLYWLENSLPKYRRDPPRPSGYNAWPPSTYEFVDSSLRWILCVLAWSLYKCTALWRADYGPFTTARPLGTIREEKWISSRFRVSISSRYDLSCWKRCKSQFLPSFPKYRKHWAVLKKGSS